MFNLNSIFSGAVNTIKSILGQKAPAPAPSASKKPIVITPSKPNVVATFNVPFGSIQGSNVNPQKTVAASTIQGGTFSQSTANSSKKLSVVSTTAAAEKQKADLDLQEQRRVAAQSVFDRTKEEYKKRALDSVDQYKKGQNGDLFSWATGGFSGEQNSRNFSQKELDKITRDQVARYDVKYNSFIEDQAARKAQIENAKFKSQAEYDDAVGLFTKWEQEQIADLEYTRAASEGLMEGYGAKAQEEGSSAIAKTTGWIGKNIIDQVSANPIFKYTLGQGDENIPSLVTLPSRGINAFSNLFRKPGDAIYDKAGNESKYGGNAWSTSYNQSNFNGKAATLSLEDYSRNKYVKMTNPNNEKVNPKPSTLPDGFKVSGIPGNSESADIKTFDQAAFEKWKKENAESLKKEWESSTQQTKDTYALANDFAMDPLTYATGGSTTVGKWTGKGVKAAETAAKATKTGAALFKFTDKVAKSKPVQWLNKEYKTPEQQFGDAVKDAKNNRAELQDRLAPRIAAIDSKLSGADKIDTSILDDLSKLTDGEAAILQRMINGKFSFRDSLSLRDLPGLRGGTAAQRERLTNIAGRWSDFAKKMELADNVTKSGWGAGRKRSFYSPRIDYTGDHTADNYNFFAKKSRDTSKSPQTASDLAMGARERYIKSRVGDLLRDESVAGRAKLLARREKLYKQYDDIKSLDEAKVRETDRLRGDIPRYIKDRFTRGTSRTGLGRSVFNSARKVATLPTRVWKKSVLAYNPAWTVNNALYNTGAATLAGGVGSLAQQAKMLRRKNWKDAMSDIPDSVKADLTGEIGSAAYKGKNPFKKADSKLNKFYGGVENWSRVAAFRAAKAKGLTDEQALKRVNKYLFDYKTKNWERPIKGVLPFWAWNKSLTKAAVTMPFDRPLAAKGLNTLDREQSETFDRDFEQVVPELLSAGYTEEQIQQIKDEQRKLYKNKLKVGDKYYNTPFNAFSQGGLSENVGFNPYLSAASESSRSIDNFGNKIGGEDASFKSRVLSKFPQYNLGKQAVGAFRVAKGIDKPKKGWIGEKGSEGYGLTKERQGYDPSLPNYDRSMDPRAKLDQSALAFVGVPRGLEFDKNKLIETKKMQKAVESYLALDTKDMEFVDAEKARQAVFDKYGITPDDFYKGILSKYDSENTKRIKGMKETAAAANKSLFEEYAAQPEGTRNLWATNKLRELNDQNYFADNPFKKSFSWINPTTVAKADKQQLVKDAVASGNWSKYTAKYGKTAKAVARDKAVSSGNWSEYASQYGTSTKKTPFEYAGKYFKSAESMAKFKEGEFWKKYVAADVVERRALIAENPEYNRRGDWTDKQWDEWKKERKASERKKARGWGDFAVTQDQFLLANKQGASKFLASRGSTTKLKWAKR